MARERIRKRVTSFQIIILGFLGIILLGSLLLTLPFATNSGESASFFDALFTATSATCVTGLVVQDTATYWSLFGQIVILILIQIGGMGIVTIAVSVSALVGRKIGLVQRSAMQESISAHQMGGIVRVTKFILKMTLCIELLGAIAMFPVFGKEFGVWKGIWYALFHSVSAFCNAGFDLMGVRGEYSSLTSFIGNPLINVVVVLLIVIGGIGFLTWDDIKTNKWRVRRYRMQTKVILSTSGILILLPALYLFFFEFSALPTGQRILSSLFQSVTTRTAGFNTADLTRLSESGQLLFIFLMLIGGSPGSTAGGMKTTTIAVLFSAAISVFCKKKHTHFFKRRVDDAVVKHAATIFLMYLVLFLAGGMIISRAESIPLLTALFETASAIGTVGLSLGITPSLGVLSRWILILLAFFGRVGGLTLIFAALSGAADTSDSKYPQEKITVG